MAKETFFIKIILLSYAMSFGQNYENDEGMVQEYLGTCLHQQQQKCSGKIAVKKKELQKIAQLKQKEKQTKLYGYVFAYVGVIIIRKKNRFL